MSTGANCRIEEKTRGRWFYELQAWPYGETEEYATFGPFPTFRAAHDHLHQNHANPGGYFSKALPGCPHDLLDPAGPKTWRFTRGDRVMHGCDRCGDEIDLTPPPVLGAAAD